jgi:thymidylate synthase ThyX
MELVKPNAKWVDASENYLLFLEKCCRVCYQSEKHIKEGSAERLLKEIVDSKHVSVLEHANAIIEFSNIRDYGRWAETDIAQRGSWKIEVS